MKKLSLLALLMAIMLSCQEEEFLQTPQNSFDQLYNYQLKGDQTKTLEGKDNPAKMFLFEENQLEIIHNGVQTIAIPYDLSSRESSNGFLYNQFIFQTERSDVKNIKLFHKERPYYEVTQQQALRAVNSIVNNLASPLVQDFIIVEYDRENNPIHSYLFFEHAEITWQDTGMVISQSSKLTEGTRTELDCIDWYWVPYPGAPFYEWTYLETTCDFGGDHNDPNGSSNTNNIPCSGSEKSCSKTKKVEEFLVMIDTTGLDLDPLLIVYGKFTKYKSITCSFGNEVLNCGEEAYIYANMTIGFVNDHMSIEELGASVVNQNTGFYKWNYIYYSWFICFFPEPCMQIERGEKNITFKFDAECNCE